MRRLVVLSIVMFSVLAMARPATADERIVFVDMERVFNEYDKTKLADGQLKKQAQEFSDERTIMIEKAKALRDELNELRSAATDEALSEEAREEKKAEVEEMLIEFRKMEQEINEFNKLRSKQLEDQGRRMRENIVEEIDVVIRNYARNNGYIAVLDSSAQSMNAINTVMYVDSRYDVTDAVIELLNQ